MNKKEQSINELKEKLEENRELASSEWNTFAEENGLFSSIVIQDYLKVNNWEELKFKLLKTYRKKSINKEIERMRNEVSVLIDRVGINSYEVEEKYGKLNDFINSYYKNNRSASKGRFYSKNNSMNINYNRSYEYLKSLTSKLIDFPTIQVWNSYAMEKRCLSAISMQYISGFNWHKLRDKVNTDINLKYFIQ